MSRLQPVGLPWLLNLCHPSVVNVVNIPTIEFKSVLKTGKIGEEDYIIAPSESRDSTKVCEKHFKDGEVLRNSTFYNEKTGETISAPMKRPKLKENAVPSPWLSIVHVILISN
ncbi:hypothetical protein AVEN_235359-1 [Araneus ventricosus]|uniref:THAP-type domain-containing protein n=1 Tax=Araneus ventricosus TaxID=182803 RepID=A0A4Y2A3L7_ARAVE|nr:hypothetical protein AVEN_235359-1 [Araneus ventricosus]